MIATTQAREPLGPQNSSVAQMFIDRVAKSPNAEAYRSPNEDGSWTSWTWAQTSEECTKLAAGLLALGLEPEQRVGIASNTNLKWLLADNAIMLAAGATTTVYASTQTEDVAYILEDSNTRILFAEDDTQVEKVRESRDHLTNLHHVVIFDGEGDGDFVITWDELRAKGEELLASNPSAVSEATAAITPDMLATLIYTSGTTGKPKGVELTHSNWVYEGAALESLGILREDDVQFLWLPLAHSFGKVLSCAQLQIGFATAVDGRVPQIVANLPVVQPTFMGAVPRIFEKVYAGVTKQATSEGGAKAKIFHWAVGVGKEAGAKELTGQSVGGALGFKKNLATKLVFSKVQERMGGRIRYFVSGSAALSRDIAEWFYAAGMPILEGYGLTETSAATCLMRPDNIGFGTVGEPLPGTEIGIADDGEILVRGPGVMRGYRNNAEANAEVFPGDGWFATGDIGEIDEKGRVKITDRKKDLVKTSAGKYIAPSAIESQFKAICGLAQAMVVHANNRNFASALISLDPDAAAVWATEHGVAGASIEDLSKNPELNAEVQAAVDQLNSGLNKWETIKKFEILPSELTIESGELTPSLKVKRKVVEEKYADVLDGMYAGAN